MKRLLFLLLFGMSLLACENEKNDGDATKAPGTKHSAANATEENIYKSGDSMLAAFNRKDWLTFVNYNHPAMVKMMGGPEAFASFIKRQMQQLPDTAVKGATLGKILQVVKTPHDQQCVVEQNMQIEIEGVDLSRTTYLIGESHDNGNTWTFLDATAKSGVSPKAIKPDLSDELKIPVVKKVN